MSSFDGFLRPCLYKDQGRSLEAAKVIERAIALNPDIVNYKYNNINLYVLLAELYRQSGNQDLSNQYHKKSKNLGFNYYSPQTYRNYPRLKAILRERKIQLVCVQYPVRSVEPLKKIFEGEEEGMIFVDNEAVFKEALKKKDYTKLFIDRFALDFGHCTREGNQLLAKNIADTILKEVFK